MIGTDPVDPALDPDLDPLDDPANGSPSGAGAGRGGGVATEPVTGPTAPSGQGVAEAVGTNWVAALLVGATLLGASGVVVALLGGGGLGAVLALVVTVAAGVAALVESHSVPLALGRSSRRLWYYARVAAVVLVAVAAARFDADGGGPGSVAWHIPTSMVAFALVVLWWRDPQRPV